MFITSTDSARKIKSCGCLFGKQSIVHGHNRKPKRTPTYICWSNLKQTKGIEICTTWQSSFATFLRDMGEKPNKKTLDRKDRSLGYFKENCLWVTYSEKRHKI